MRAFILAKPTSSTSGLRNLLTFASSRCRAADNNEFEIPKPKDSSASSSIWYTLVNQKVSVFMMPKRASTVV